MAKKHAVASHIEQKYDTDGLIKELHLLRKELRLANSWRYRLLLALITGFGTVFGATVVVALVLFILSQLASIELIRPLIEWTVHIVENSRK